MKAEEIAALPVETRYGSVNCLPDDDPIGKALMDYGEWAQGEIEFLSALIGRGSSVIDVGAYIGTHTLAFACRVGSGGSVRAFEPQPAIFALLERTLDRDDCSNVIATCAGLAGSAGEMIVPAIDYNSHVNAGAVSLMRPGTGADREGERVPVIALDDLALETCDLVKIDAEGMAPEVLLGMAGTVERHRPIIYAECNSVDSGLDTLGAFNRTDYAIFVVRAAAYNPANVRENPHNFFGVARESGLLCVPNEARHLIPASTALVEVLPGGAPQAIVEAILGTPRFGDATCYDRDPVRLREQLNAANEAAKRLGFRAASLARQLHSAEDQRGEVKRLQGEVERLRGLLAWREQEMAALHRSTSWRVTAPLRLLKRAIGGRGNGVARPS